MNWLHLLAVASGTLVLNLPFGFWRAGVRKFSPVWFLAVHAPVPMIVGLRLAAGLGWRLSTFPVLVGAFFGGQFLGGRIRYARRTSKGACVGRSAAATLTNSKRG
jgi:hypothetical protein